MAYQFIKTKATYFYGWEVIWFGNLEAKIATPEKAPIDLVQFHRNTYTVDLVIEILAKYEESVDIQRLAGYLESSPVTVQRIFGFIFELVGLRSQAEVLEALVGERASRSKVTSESALFNARWRLYYDDYFWKHINTLHNI